MYIYILYILYIYMLYMLYIYVIYIYVYTAKKTYETQLLGTYRNQCKGLHHSITIVFETERDAVGTLCFFSTLVGFSPGFHVISIFIPSLTPLLSNSLNSLKLKEKWWNYVDL